MSSAPPSVSGLPATPAQPAPRSHILLGMVIGAVIFGIGCGSGLSVGWLAGSAGNPFDALDDLGVDLTPDAAIDMEFEGSPTVGAPFELRISVNEISGEAHSFRTLDLNGAITEYFDVTDISPKPIDDYSEFGWLEYTYESTLLPNETLEFTLTLVPKSMGLHSGSIDAYYDDYESATLEIAIPVGPPN